MCSCGCGGGDGRDSGEQVPRTHPSRDGSGGLVGHGGCFRCENGCRQVQGVEKKRNLTVLALGEYLNSLFASYEATGYAPV